MDLLRTTASSRQTGKPRTWTLFTVSQLQLQSHFGHSIIVIPTIVLSFVVPVDKTEWFSVLVEAGAEVAVESVGNPKGPH